MIPVQMSKVDAIQMAIYENEAKIRDLKVANMALREELAKELSPFKAGDKVNFVWGKLHREGQVVSVDSAQFRPYYALTVKPVLKSGELGASIRVVEDINKISKAA